MHTTQNSNEGDVVKTRLTIGSLVIGIALVLSILKMTNVIDWDWWWVTISLWILPALWLVGMALYGLLFAAASLTILFSNHPHERKPVHTPD